MGAFGFYAIVARPNKLAWAKINAVRLCACDSRACDMEGRGRPSLASLVSPPDPHLLLPIQDYKVKEAAERKEFISWLAAQKYDDEEAATE